MWLAAIILDSTAIMLAPDFVTKWSITGLSNHSGWCFPSPNYVASQNSGLHCLLVTCCEGRGDWTLLFLLQVLGIWSYSLRLTIVTLLAVGLQDVFLFTFLHKSTTQDSGSSQLRIRGDSFVHHLMDPELMTLLCLGIHHLEADSFSFWILRSTKELPLDFSQNRLLDKGSTPRSLF